MMLDKPKNAGNLMPGKIVSSFGLSNLLFPQIPNKGLFHQTGGTDLGQPTPSARQSKSLVYQGLVLPSYQWNQSL
jgi:hypothetical protein